MYTGYPQSTTILVYMANNSHYTTCEPVSIECWRVPSAAFQKHICLSCVPPPEASKFLEIGHQAETR